MITCFKTLLNIVKLTEVSLKIYISLAAYLLTGYSRPEMTTTEWSSELCDAGVLPARNTSMSHHFIVTLRCSGNVNFEYQIAV